MPTSEAGLVKSIKNAIAKAYPNALIIKTVGNAYQGAGIPDLLVCIEGRFIGLEVKHQKPNESLEHARGRATSHQLNYIKKIRNAGGVGEIVLSVEEALKALE